jgi:multiple antibiotic resistance protein
MLNLLSFKEILSVTLILFSVIDILGSVPIIIDLRKKNQIVYPGKATIISGFIMVAFLFIGESILKLFGVDVQSFALAGSFVMFLIGLEMVLNVVIFRPEPEYSTTTIVPLAFPLIAGAGTMTTLISLRAEYQKLNVLFGVFLNLIFVYAVLLGSGWISRRLGVGGTNVLRKISGIILLAISIKLFKKNI